MNSTQNILTLLLCLTSLSLPAKAEETLYFARRQHADLQKVFVELDIDLQAKSIRGKTKQTYTVLSQSLDTLVLDSVDLSITSARCNRKPCSYQSIGGQLRISLPGTLKRGDHLQVDLDYSGSPKLGMHFFAPSPDFPKEPLQVWTQGEPDATRHWLPIFDSPVERTQSEIVVHIKQGNTVISNGKLIDKKNRDGKSRFHFKQDIEHSVYLLSIVAGSFASISQKHNGKLPLQFHVPTSKKSRAKKVFANTSTFLHFFEKLTQIPYPYLKYDQAVVHRFRWGGMENTSATTLHEFVLYPSKQEIEWKQRTDNLLAHEIAHQWFGDFIASKDWSHLWLNEGFATYTASWALEGIYGKDYFTYQMERARKGIIASNNKRATRSRKFSNPNHLFDSAIYDRGAWFLHMLRSFIGEQAFRQGIQNYAREFQGRAAESSDLRKAFEKTSKQDLSQFFFQWLENPGWAKLTTSWVWNEKKKEVEISIQQDAIRGQKNIFYHMPLSVEFVFAEGKNKPTRSTFNLQNKKDVQTFQLERKPVTVRIDPDQQWLKDLKSSRSTEELQQELALTAPLTARLDAINELSGIISEQASQALAKSLNMDPFWGARAQAARALGKNQSYSAKDSLRSALSKERHPLVREKIVKELAKDGRESTKTALKSWMKKESSDRVHAELGSYFVRNFTTKDKTAIQSLSRRSSHDDRSIRGLVSAMKRHPREEWRKTLLRLSKAPHSASIRKRAISALGKLPYDRSSFYKLTQQCHLPVFEIIHGCIDYFHAHSSQSIAKSELQGIAEGSIFPELRKRASRRLKKPKKATGKEQAKIKTDLNKLRQQVKTVEDELKQMKSKKKSLKE